MHACMLQLAKYRKLVNKLLGDHIAISGEINHPPLYSAFNAN